MFFPVSVPVAVSVGIERVGAAAVDRVPFEGVGQEVSVAIACHALGKTRSICRVGTVVKLVSIGPSVAVGVSKVAVGARDSRFKPIGQPIAIGVHQGILGIAVWISRIGSIKEDLVAVEKSVPVAIGIVRVRPVEGFFVVEQSVTVVVFKDARCAPEVERIRTGVHFFAIAVSVPIGVVLFRVCTDEVDFFVVFEPVAVAIFEIVEADAEDLGQEIRISWHNPRIPVRRCRPRTYRFAQVALHELRRHTLTARQTGDAGRRFHIEIGNSDPSVLEKHFDLERIEVLGTELRNLKVGDNHLVGQLLPGNPTAGRRAVLLGIGAALETTAQAMQRSCFDRLRSGCLQSRRGLQGRETEFIQRIGAVAEHFAVVEEAVAVSVLVVRVCAVDAFLFVRQEVAIGVVREVLRIRRVGKIVEQLFAVRPRVTVTVGIVRVRSEEQFFDVEQSVAVAIGRETVDVEWVRT